MDTIRSIHWAFIPLAAACVITACGDPTQPVPKPPPPPAEFVPSSVVFTAARPSAAPRDTIGLGVVVRDAANRPGTGLEVSFSVVEGDGLVVSAVDTTDSSGRASVGLVLGRAEEQRVRAVVDTIAGEVLVRAVPILARLLLEPADTVVLGLNDSIPLRVTAIDRDSVVIPTPAALTLVTNSEERALVRLPVLGQGSNGHVVLFAGPGSTSLAVRNGSVVSSSAQFTVSPPVAIADTISATTPADAGAEVTVLGYRLDLLADDAITVAGVAATMTAKDSAAFRFTLPARDFSGCQGMAVAQVDIANAQMLTSAAVRYRRNNEVRVPSGSTVMLGAASPTCLRLEPAEEYMLMFLDGRAPRFSVTTAEGDTLMGTRFTFDIRDRSGSGLGLPVSLKQGRVTLPDPPIESTTLRPSLESSLSASDPPADAYFFRRTPWAVGDSVSFNDRWPDGTFEWRRGRVVNVKGPLVVVVMDFDAPLNLPSRLAGLYAAMDTVIRTSIPLLKLALADGTQEASFGTGQILISVRDIGWTGGATNGTGQIILSPFPLPGATGAIELNWFQVLTHEMGHVWQDQFTTEFCQETGICGGGVFNPWGFEGGAEFLAEEAGRLAHGIDLNANAPRRELVTGSFYFPCCTGLVPGPTFEAGYVGSTWFLRYMLHRVMDAGASYETAIREVARGAYEGWYGHGMRGLPGMIGLHARLSPWLGAWDPVTELIHGGMRVAMDDLGAGLDEPSILDAWMAFGVPPVLGSGGSGFISESSRGTGFGYVMIRDGGRGGTFELSASVPGVEWAIARVR